MPMQVYSSIHPLALGCARDNISDRDGTREDVHVTMSTDPPSGGGFRSRVDDWWAGMD